MVQSSRFISINQVYQPPSHHSHGAELLPQALSHGQVPPDPLQTLPKYVHNLELAPWVLFKRQPKASGPETRDRAIEQNPREVNGAEGRGGRSSDGTDLPFPSCKCRFLQSQRSSVTPLDGKKMYQMNKRGSFISCL